MADRKERGNEREWKMRGKWKEGNISDPLTKYAIDSDELLYLINDVSRLRVNDVSV